MSSDVEISNNALIKLGAGTITSLSEDSPSANVCNARYDSVRDMELRAHPWNFAVKRVVLAESTSAPAFGLANQFALPSDFLRLLPPNFPNDLDWQIENGGDGVIYIRTNDTSALQVRYIARIVDPNQFDVLFREALACSLAMEICEKITQSNSKYEAISKNYIRVIREARRINAFENIAQEPPESTWITVRY